jgi:hypothetical protein
MRRLLLTAMMLIFTISGHAQAPPAPPAPPAAIEEPNAQWTRDQFRQLMQRYPPELRNVLSIDPTLLSNQSYLAPYPALASFLSQHPDVARNPSF